MLMSFKHKFCGFDVRQCVLAIEAYFLSTDGGVRITIIGDRG